MKSERLNFSRRYKEALLAHLKMGPPAGTASASVLFDEAQKAGLRAGALGRIHEHIMVADILSAGPPEKRGALCKQAGRFFAQIEASVPGAQQGGNSPARHLGKVVASQSARTAELASSSRILLRENARLRAMEDTFRKSEIHDAESLEQSRRLQEQLRRLSHQILTAQEDERRKISRELHDVIAQALTGINVRLATLKKEASLSTKGLERNIARTQRVVVKSTNLVHQFARELRPASLDDLGLIPALHSFMKSFSARAGVRTWLTAFAGVEQLDADRRTVLFRVAQEALTNVARHARASRADVTIEKIGGDICMKIKDDGRSFQVQRVLLAKGGKSFGVIGMRERVEMVGGRFQIESVKDDGTTVTAHIPFVVADPKQPPAAPRAAPITSP